MPPPTTLRLSMRLRSCSRANASGVEVCKEGAAATAGADEACCSSGLGFGFAETEAGTKDIMVVAGRGADAGGALAGLLCLGVWPWKLPLPRC